MIMKEEEMEKEEKERKKVESRGQVQAIEEEEHGVDMEEGRAEIKMRGTTTKEEIEEDTEEEEEVVSEVVIEVAGEGVVGRIPAPPTALFTLTCRKSM